MLFCPPLLCPSPFCPQLFFPSTVLALLTKHFLVLQQSYKAKVAFEKCQRDCQVDPVLILVNPGPTRWNGYYMMLEKCLELKRALTLFFLEFDVEDPITNIEWELATKLVKIMKPLYDVTVQMSGEKFVSVSQVIPLVGILTGKYKVYEDFDENMATIAEDFSHKIGTSIEERLANKVEENPTYAIATILDPRFKTVGFFGGSLKIKIAKQFVKQEAEEMFPQQDEPTANEVNEESEEAKDDHGIWESLVQKKSVAEQYQKPNFCQIDQELAEFLSKKTISHKEDAIEWWVKIGRASYPQLFEIATKYLIIPGSSVPSERVFSSLSLICNKKRTKLSRENVEKFVMLHKNMSIEDVY